MSKNGFKKFKKNDYSYDDEEYADKPRSHYLDRKRERRVQRALKVKDVSELVEDEDFDDDNPHYISESKY